MKARLCSWGSAFGRFRGYFVLLLASAVCLTTARLALLTMEFAGFHVIRTTWDGLPIDRSEYVAVRAVPVPHREAVRIEVDAPFFNSPAAPPCPAGQSCPELWNYEVVEMFFLGDKDRYLEIELCPHGQYIGLLLNGVRNVYTDKLSLTDFVATVYADGKRWRGTATLPSDFFAPGTNRFNAYAIHGDGDARVYRALFPAVKDAEHPNPDFHRLEFFRPVTEVELIRFFEQLPPSKYWGNLTDAASARD